MRFKGFSKLRMPLQDNDKKDPRVWGHVGTRLLGNCRNLKIYVQAHSGNNAHRQSKKKNHRDESHRIQVFRTLRSIEAWGDVRAQTVGRG